MPFAVSDQCVSFLMREKQTTPTRHGGCADLSSMQSSFASKMSVASEKGAKTVTQQSTSASNTTQTRTLQNKFTYNNSPNQSSRGTISVARGILETMAEGISRAMSRTSDIATQDSVSASSHLQRRQEFRSVLN